MRIEGYIVDLPMMLVQLCGLQAGMPQIIHNDLAARSGSCDEVTSVTFGPGDVGDVDLVHLPWLSGCLSRCASDCRSKIDVLCAVALFHPYGLEDGLSRNYGMAPSLVDAYGPDFQTSSVGCSRILCGAYRGRPRLDAVVRETFIIRQALRARGP